MALPGSPLEQRQEEQTGYQSGSAARREDVGRRYHMEGWQAHVAVTEELAAAGVPSLLPPRWEDLADDYGRILAGAVLVALAAGRRAEPSPMSCPIDPFRSPPRVGAYVR